MNQFGSLLLLIAICASETVLATQKQYYRYLNDDGVVVISSRIPPRYVPSGYDVIARDGRLLKKVPPELSSKEKSALAKGQELKAKLKSWDDDLIRRYSHIADIEAAKERKLNQNRNHLRIVARNIEKIDGDIARLQHLAADDERDGRKASQDILDNIEALKHDRLAELNKQKNTLDQQRTIIEKFDQDIERFKIIQRNKSGD